MLLLVPLLAISATAQARANDNSAPPPGVAVVAGYARLAIVVIGIAIIAQSSARFERTRRAIDRDEVMQIPQPRVDSLLSPALTIAVVIGAFTFVAHDSNPISIGELCGYENRKLAQQSAARLPNHSALTSRVMGRKRRTLRPAYNSSDPFRYRILTHVQLSH